MRRLRGWLGALSLLAAMVIAGCSASATAGHAATSSGPSSSSTTASTPATTSTPPPGPKACRSSIGLPTAAVVDEAVNVKSPAIRCYTGDTAATDSSTIGVTNCDPTNPASARVYYWASANTAATDQHVYAAKHGGVVHVVAGASAADFFSTPGGIASVLLAVGPC